VEKDEGMKACRAGKVAGTGVSDGVTTTGINSQQRGGMRFCLNPEAKILTWSFYGARLTGIRSNAC
jgi:hypothetical protein